MAVRSPGFGKRPPQLLTISVRSSSESRGSKGRVSTGYSRTQPPVVRSISTTALRLAAATNSREPSRVIAIPPGTGLPLAPAGCTASRALGVSLPPS